MTEENSPAGRPNIPYLPEGYITKDELARRIKRTKRTIEKWQRRKSLPSVKAGPRSVYHWPTVEKFLEQHCPELFLEGPEPKAASVPQPLDPATQTPPMKTRADLKKLGRHLARVLEAEDQFSGIESPELGQKGYAEIIAGSAQALQQANQLVDSMRPIILTTQQLVWLLQYAIATARALKAGSTKEKTVTETKTIPTTPTTEETKGTP